MSSQQTHTKTRYSIPSALLAADYIASTIATAKKKPIQRMKKKERKTEREMLIRQRKSEQTTAATTETKPK